MLFVSGATGNVGGEVVRALVSAGEKVRGLARTRESATDVGVPIEVFVGDMNDPETLRDALRGARGAFLLGGFRDMPGLLAEVRRAGVAHVVLLSSGCAVGGQMTNAIARGHLVSEAAVRDSGVPWTILQPSGFMSNALRWSSQLRTGDVVSAPFADTPIATIDPFDIAAVAAKVFTSKGHFGRSYLLTGPEALRPAQQVAVLAHVLGRALRFVAQSDDDARVELGRMFPAEFVDAFFRFFVGGEFDDSIVRPTVLEITGKAPRTFEQWSRAHAGAFR